jgi:glucose dehydrogenase
MWLERDDTKRKTARGCNRMRRCGMPADPARLWSSGLTIDASDENIAAADSGWTIGANKDWAQPAGDYANTRYSSLKEINSENVKTLIPMWTFSTGVLRGHEGAPLVVGDLMYPLPGSKSQ